MDNLPQETFLDWTIIQRIKKRVQVHRLDLTLDEMGKLCQDFIESYEARKHYMTLDRLFEYLDLYLFEIA
jgi:hypothetical protein